MILWNSLRGLRNLHTSRENSRSLKQSWRWPWDLQSDCSGGCSGGSSCDTPVSPGTASSTHGACVKLQTPSSCGGFSSLRSGLCPPAPAGFELIQQEGCFFLGVSLDLRQLTQNMKTWRPRALRHLQETVQQCSMPSLSKASAWHKGATSDLKRAKQR